MIGSIFILLAGCNMDNNKIAACDQKIPTSNNLLENSVFASLRYHKRAEMAVSYSSQEGGYNVWADSKFDFSSALQFNFIPINKSTPDQFCINKVMLRLALPMNAQKQNMLFAFNSQITHQSAFDLDFLNKKLNDALNKREVYHSIETQNNINVKAGIVHHPFRGDFFAESIEVQ